MGSERKNTRTADQNEHRPVRLDGAERLSQRSDLGAVGGELRMATTSSGPWQGLVLKHHEKNHMSISVLRVLMWHQQVGWTVDEGGTAIKGAGYSSSARVR